MKARVSNFLAIGLVVLAAADLAIMIPSIRAARQNQEAFSGGSILVHDVHYTQFGLEWWLVPFLFILTAISLFVWRRWSNKHGRHG